MEACTPSCSSFCLVMFFQDSSNSVSKIRTSLLNLVDLAGSERQRDTQSMGMRLKVTVPERLFSENFLRQSLPFSPILFYNVVITSLFSVGGRRPDIPSRP